MKSDTLRHPEPVTGGPHLNQAVRDLLDDLGVGQGGDLTGLGDALDAEAVTAP